MGVSTLFVPLPSSAFSFSRPFRETQLPITLNLLVRWQTTKPIAHPIVEWEGNKNAVVNTPPWSNGEKLEYYPLDPMLQAILGPELPPGFEADPRWQPPDCPAPPIPILVQTGLGPKDFDGMLSTVRVLAAC